MNVASEWGMALALNDGTLDGNSSNARLLTRMIPRTSEGRYELDPNLPSSAEALAVLAGNTLLLSSAYAPFTHAWVYRNATLPQPVYEGFPTRLQSQQYGSGGVYGWQKMFHLVLTLIFATNVFCLVCLFWNKGQVTDFTEPQNLFTLSINSPPSQHLAGSCGGGPEKAEYAVNWFIKVHPGDDHVYIQDGYRKTGDDPPTERTPPSTEAQPREVESPLMKSFSRLSQKRLSLL